MKTIFTMILRTGVVLLALFNIAAMFAGSHYRLELLTHFRVYYLGGAIFLGILLFLLKKWVWGGAALLIVAINGFFILPYYQKPDFSGVQSVGTLKAMTINVYTGNQNIDGVVNLIKKEQPDLVGFQEIDQRWMEGLKPLTEKLYPYYRFLPRGDNFGIAIISRFPLKKLKTLDLGGGVPSIEAQLHYKKEVIHVLVTHPMPPMTGEYARRRNWQLKEMGNYFKKHSRLIALGDFNVTPWSPHFKQMVAKSGVYHARRGYGLQGSFPAHAPKFGRLPIDHILVSKNIKTVAHRTLERIGSDHLPVMGTFEILADKKGTKKVQ